MLARKKQSGFALLVFLIALMGIGGIALAGITQEFLKTSQDKRLAHNQRVLKEAKNALLMYTYNYPNFNSEGPGRLPCPDENNDGIGDANGPSCVAVGRFPWNHSNMDFYEAKDASGETLWYAVSDSFHNLGGGPATVNSESIGTISIYDNSGSLLYDGASSGVAAVIIAPGDPLARDEDNNSSNGYEYIQVRNTSAQKEDPKNYLDDHINGMDNSVFVNSNNTLSNSFVLGPVRDASQKKVVINDQIILVTVEEVISMAEQATLDAYQKAISDYQFNIWGTAGSNYRYSWLDDYDSISAGVLTEYDADINTNIGRVPSIFEEYFSVNSFDSEDGAHDLILSINIDGQIHNLNVGPPGSPSIKFKANGDLVSALNNGDSITRYFWDGHNINTDVNSPNDGVWEVCPVVTNDEEDCNRDTSGNFKGGTASDVWLKVRQVTIDFSGGTPIEFPFSDRTASPIEYWEQGTPENPNISNHVYIAGQYNDTAAYISSFTYAQDDDFLNGYTVGSSGTLVFDTGDTIKVGVPYYPVIPRWSLSNDWHNSIQMAVAQDYRPDGAGDCLTNTPCLTVQNLGGINTNKVALLSMAGSSLNTSDDGAAGYSDDLAEIFEAENADLDAVFTRKIMDDKILILREQ